MIVGYHIIFGAYGFWLPNDPRGSWSDFVGSWDLFRYGPATKTNERRSLAYDAHDHDVRVSAKKSLKHPAVEFTGVQARAVARGFSSYVQRSDLKIWACAVLPDHVHLVVARPAIRVEQLVIQLKGDATQQLIRENIHPLEGRQQPGTRPPKCWARGEWKVFLDPEDVPRAIQYVEENPLKEGKRKQEWSFVVPYEE
ncbi:transposase [Humisphaera borealis]|uniref:Transposase n=1 Tax=Humisphaera borealis TaxID=2807512 RepID=A0A7M2WVR7_9BACT|nr:transposase [Humisphaera borealis]QOV89424.1 transposase [Humisphaera borealis]